MSWRRYTGPTMEQPLLRTPRLLLRPFALADAADVQRLAGAPEVADTLLNMPHPYEDGMAEQWIATHAAQYAQGVNVVYAVVLQDGNALAGAVSMGITPRHRRAELAYWLGLPYWNRGYMTEAAGALLGFGFGTLGLHRVTATHFTRNPASGRVMQKLGMVREGTFREHFLKGDTFEDLEMYGLLAADWQARQAAVRQPAP